MKVAPLLSQSETFSTYKLSNLGNQSFTSDDHLFISDTDNASMENHAGRQSSAGELESCQSVSSNDQEEWPWASPASLAPLAVRNKPIPVWTNR